MLAHSLRPVEPKPRTELDAYIARVKPYADTLIVEVEPDEYLATGLLVRKTNGEQSQLRTGRVLAAGPGARGKRGGRIPLPYSVGDRVLFARGEAFHKMRLSDREIRFLRADQLEDVVIETDARVDACFVD
jgi:co-chaperonin GroES (HSP10)